MNVTLFIIGLIALSALTLIIGLKVSKGQKDQQDYFLAGRKLGFFALMVTLVATQVGGGSILGAADEAATVGPFALFYSGGQALGFAILALGLGARLRKLTLSTTSEIFAKFYGSKILQKVAALFSIVSLSGILVAIALATRKFMYAAGVENDLWFILPWVIFVIYTVTGGLRAIVTTDILLLAIIVASIGTALVVGYTSKPTLFASAWQNLQNFSAPTDTLQRLGGWLLMPFLFMFVEQDMTQRCFAGKSGKIVSLACLVSAVVLVLIASIPVFFGMIGGQLPLKAGSSVFMQSVIALTNPTVAALVGCGVMAAIISTADALLCAISSNICHDLMSSSKPSLKSVKLITAALGIGALLASYLSSSVINVMVESYEISVSALFVPVMAALLARKSSGRTAIAWSAVICGLGGFLLARCVELPLPKQAVGVLCSALGVGICWLWITTLEKKAAADRVAT